IFAMPRLVGPFKRQAGVLETSEGESEMCLVMKSITMFAATAAAVTLCSAADAGQRCRGRQVTVVAYHSESPKPSIEGKDIVDTAVSAGSFKTLAAALKAADLIDALKGEGPFTVFAPTDEAFAKL